ncbi:hypothetical protein KHQ88_05760 [Mycoplasmatota bacterium]|nr:hypothetical protein KHQ88_05760 [Mycoplasmatota bacterium]
MEQKVIRSKFNLIILTFSTLLVVVFSVVLSYAWFTDEDHIIYAGEMGFVDVDMNVYFDDGLGGEIPAEEVMISSNENKEGVYRINITDADAPYFVEDLRISINVKSSVDTYFRIKIYEQMTFIYTDINGVTNELASRYDQGVELNYDLDHWYDHSTFDGYLYYQNKVQRISENTPLVIGFVDSYFPDRSFSTKGPGYSLQIAFSIEAVQSDDGPIYIWGLEIPPWGGVW